MELSSFQSAGEHTRSLNIYITAIIVISVYTTLIYFDNLQKVQIMPIRVWHNMSIIVSTQFLISIKI